MRHVFLVIGYTFALLTQCRCADYVFLPERPIEYSVNLCSQISMMVSTLELANIKLSQRYLHNQESPADFYEPSEFIGLERGEGEWSRILENADSLLASPRAMELVNSLTELNRSMILRLAVVERSRFQNELWDVFDEVFACDSTSAIKQQMLRELARVIWICSLTKDEVVNLEQKFSDDLPYKFSLTDYERFYLSWDHHFHIHEEDYSHRRYAVVSFYVPKIYAHLVCSDDFIDRLMKRDVTMPVGTVSLINETILNIDQTLAIRDSGVCVLSRKRNFTGVPQSTLSHEYAMALRLHEKGISSWATVPDWYPTWDHINLPAVPNKLKPGLLTPQASSCVNCHGDKPLSFNPSSTLRLKSELTFGAQFPTNARDRLINSKSLSPEFKCLTTLIETFKHQSE